MRSERKRSILGVCEHFEHEYNAKITLLDDFFAEKFGNLEGGGKFVGNININIQNRF